MRTSLAASFALACFIGLLASGSLSAQRNSAAPKTGTALVDTSAIVQGSTKLKTALDELKAEYDKDAAVLKQEGEAGNKLTADYQKMKPDDPARKKLEEELHRKRTAFELHGKRANDKAADGTTKVYFRLTRELSEELARYAQATGVQVVLRHDPTPPDLSDPRSVMAEISKPIVYQSEGDITATLVETLNRKPAATTATRPGAPAARPTAPR